MAENIALGYELPEGPVRNSIGEVRNPTEDTITAFFDGAKNAHGAGLGVVLWHQGEIIAKASGYLGPWATHNEAEYASLVEALRLTYRLGARAVLIFGDSQTIINLACGEARLRKHRLRKYHEAAQQFRSVFREIHMGWILREKNAAADQLSKEATRSRSQLWTMRELEDNLRDTITFAGATAVQLQQDRSTKDGKEEAKEAQRLLHGDIPDSDVFPFARRLMVSYLKRSARLKDASRWPTNYLLWARMNGFAELLYRSIHMDKAWTEVPENKAIIRLTDSVHHVGKWEARTLLSTCWYNAHSTQTLRSISWDSGRERYNGVGTNMGSNRRRYVRRWWRMHIWISSPQRWE